jgi:transposase
MSEELRAREAAKALGVHYKTILAWAREADDLTVAEPRLEPRDVRRTLTNRIRIRAEAVDRLRASMADI